MFIRRSVLFQVILVLFVINVQIVRSKSVLRGHPLVKRGLSGSGYGTSTGLSGNGYGYPSSSAVSAQTNTAHGYPPSSGVSGITVSHGYTPFGAPSGVNSGPSYPASNGLSGSTVTQKASTVISSRVNTTSYGNPSYGPTAKTNFTSSYGNPSYGQIAKQNYSSNYRNPNYGQIPKQNYSSNYRNPTYGQIAKQNYTANYGNPSYVQISKQNYTNNYGIPSYGQIPKQNYTNNYGNPSYGQIPKQNYTNNYGSPSYGGVSRQNYTSSIYPVSPSPVFTGYNSSYRNQSSGYGHSNYGTQNKPGNSKGHTVVKHPYNPPQQIKYTPAHGPSITYPIYHGIPPAYIYQTQNSGSKYGNLLAGLALLNLGTLSTAYGQRQVYQPNPNEVCKLGIRNRNGYYEESKIDCQLITHFILETEANKINTGSTKTVNNVQQIPPGHTNTMLPNGTLVHDTTITANAKVEGQTTLFSGSRTAMLANGTLIDLNAPSDKSYGVSNIITSSPTPTNPVNVGQNTGTVMLPNGMLVPLNATTNNTYAGTTVITVTNTTETNATQTKATVTNALDVKGKSVVVTPGMQCYIIRTTTSSEMWKGIPCEVLQKYAQSLKSSAQKNIFSIVMLVVVLVGMLA